MLAVGFRNLNNDDQKDIIIISEYITGVGAEACVPFKVIDVFYQEGRSFRVNRPLNKDLNNSLNYDKLKTVDDVAHYIKVTLAQ